MIKLFSGTPGSGKSLHTAKLILERASMGRPIIANFQVKLPEKKKYKKAAFFYVPNDQLTPDFLIAFSQGYFLNKPFHEESILLIIDECQLLFNAREWQQSGRAGWLSFFTQHRHFGYQIILVAQFDRMIDKQIRSLIEYEFIHRKVSNFGNGGFIISLLSGGELFVSVETWYPLKERISAHFYHARKKFFSIYDSYTTFGDAVAVRHGDDGAPSSTAPASPKKKSLRDKLAASVGALPGRIKPGKYAEELHPPEKLSDVFGPPYAFVKNDDVPQKSDEIDDNWTIVENGTQSFEDLLNFDKLDFS